jgi:hypothetical protein
VIEDQITTLRPYINPYGLGVLVARVAMSLGVDGVVGRLVVTGSFVVGVARRPSVL